MSEKDDKKVFNLVKGGGKPNKLKKLLEDFKENLPILIEYSEPNAKLCMARYKAFLAEGFDSVQALSLTMKMLE